MNKSIITGRITNDLELKKTQSNKSVWNFTLAVKKDRKDADGNYSADFLEVQCWEQRAEYLSNYAGKGTMIGVCGRLETNSYVNKNGQKIKVTYIQAETVEILSQPQHKEESVKETSDEYPVDNSMFGGNDYGFEQEELPFY